MQMSRWLLRNEMSQKVFKIIILVSYIFCLDLCSLLKSTYKLRFLRIAKDAHILDGHFDATNFSYTSENAKLYVVQIFKHV